MNLRTRRSDQIKTEFARLYPNWPASLKLTLAQMQEQIDSFKSSKAVCDLIRKS